jgi:Fe-S cluster assembly protein SufD
MKSLIIPKNSSLHILDDSNDAQEEISITVEENAQLNLITLHQNENKITRSYSINLNYSSQITFNFISHAIKESTINLSIFLNEPHAHAQIFGLYALNADEKITINTIQHHKAPQTISALTYKGLLGGCSNAHYQGMINIDEKAQGANASLQNKNLILSQQARVTSIPSLQVLTNDVQAKHGSAIGQLDLNHIWYLQSRGFTQDEAKKILLNAFIHDVFFAMHNERKEILKDQIVKNYETLNAH